MKNAPKVIRCAIYTRKSTDENLDNDFNTLDSQREYCEAFVKSQESLGWRCLPDRYDDGGYSGGTLNRPAFKRLMADIESGKVQCIVCYKLERLSRSLLDFLNLMKLLEARGVSFCSVTQQFNTATSAGRMSLNMMLTLAQYERENASERTRDKIAAARKRGKWSGGRPLLGYDIDRETKRLVVNADEADRVRRIFKLYLEHQALLPVVAELAGLGWVNKLWTTAKGSAWGGRAFDKGSLHKLLTNVAYVGLVRHHDQTYPAEHEAIVPEKTFQKVHSILQRNGKTGGAIARNKHHALLKGMLVCSRCQCSMGHSYSTKNRTVKYRYYLCLNASKRGWQVCPAPSVPAGEIERFVVERLATLVQDPALVRATVIQARRESGDRIATLESEDKRLRQDLKRLHGELKVVTASGGDDINARVTELNERLEAAQTRAGEVSRELELLRTAMVTEAEVLAAFARFDELWATLAPHEQMTMLRHLIQRVEWDGRQEQIKIVFHPTGLRGLVERTRGQEIAA